MDFLHGMENRLIISREKNYLLRKPRVNIFSLLIFIFWGTNLSALEEPKYSVLKEYETFEIRSYDSYLVAEVDVEGAYNETGNEAFRILAGYIFGENKNSIGQSEKIKMTAPVTVKPDNEEWVLHFVMPSNYDMSQLPVPNNSSILLKKIEAHLAAVIIFSGFTTDAKIQNKTEELKVWLEKKDFKIAGPQQIARYNDPFTLPWLRRNEIIFKVTAKN